MAWHALARCRDSVVDFYSDDPGEIAVAKQVCGGCSVRAQCLSDGLAEYGGIWGGMTPAEREVTRRSQRSLSTVTVSPFG